MDSQEKVLNPISTAKDNCPESTCTSTETCCKNNENTSFGCCPFANGVCCDQYHCCPPGFNCGQNKCIKSNRQESILFSQINYKKPEEECPSNTCRESQTCCKKTSGTYSCCHYSNATCCPDGLHCCPNGFNCDIQKKECRRNNEVTKIMPHIETVPFQKKTSIKDCRECPHGTCCKLRNGRIGCCPYQNAVCCSDDTNCCPYGYTCTESNCVKQVF